MSNSWLYQRISKAMSLSLKILSKIAFTMQNMYISHKTNLKLAKARTEKYQMASPDTRIGLRIVFIITAICNSLITITVLHCCVVCGANLAYICDLSLLLAARSENVHPCEQFRQSLTLVSLPSRHSH